MSYRDEYQEQLQRKEKLASYSRFITLLLVVFLSFSSFWVFSTGVNKTNIQSVCKLVKKYPITYYRGTSDYPAKVLCENKELFTEVSSVKYADMIEGKYYTFRNIEGVGGKWFIIMVLSLVYLLYPCSGLAD